MGGCPRNKENGKIFRQSREFGIKLHVAKKGADVLEQLYNQQQLSLEQLINLL